MLMTHALQLIAAIFFCEISNTSARRLANGAASRPAVGILGTGWGLQVQVPQLRAAGLHVSAIYSRNLERARQLAVDNEIDHGFDSIEQLCGCPDVDLVTCIGPTHTRCPQALAALKAGKHVLVDKPMALNEEEASSMLAASRAGGQHAWMDFELRAVPAVVEARRIIASGELGQPQHISFRCLDNFPFLAKDATLSHWAQRECGGGVFSAVGTHYTDLSRHLTGKEVSRVSAIQRQLTEQLPNAAGKLERVTADGLTSVSMELSETSAASDAPPLLVTMLISGSSPGIPPENMVTISCERGVLQFNILTSTLSIFRADGSVETFGGGGNAWSEVGTKALGRAILGALASKEGPVQEGGVAISDLATLADGVLVQRATDAVHASAARGGEWLEVNMQAP